MLLDCCCFDVCAVDLAGGAARMHVQEGGSDGKGLQPHGEVQREEGQLKPLGEPPPTVLLWLQPTRSSPPSKDDKFLGRESLY